MIAIASRYNGIRADDATWVDTSSCYCAPSRGTATDFYIITNRHIPSQPSLSFKELMKLWAKYRMKVWWFNPCKVEPRKVIKIKPIPLRGVRLWGYG
jgi:hypothetical protein